MLGIPNTDVKHKVHRCSVYLLIFAAFLIHQARRSFVKLDIYRKFTNALAVSVIASVVWIGYEVCKFTIYIHREHIREQYATCILSI